MPVVVRTRIESVTCGHTEDDLYEFDLPLATVQAMEAHEAGTCRRRGADPHASEALVAEAVGAYPSMTTGY